MKFWFLFVFSISLFSHEESRLFSLPSFQVKERLFEEKIGEDEIVIFENPLFGRVLSVNGALRKTAKDEAMYHEMLVHPALLTHGKALSVLILGGGDGGVLREVTRHKEVEKIVLVEPNIRLVEIVKQYFPGFSGKAFEDVRLQILTQDIGLYLQETKDVFDVILCDFVQPYSFSKTFYQDCRKHLSLNGILVHQTYSPFFEQKSLKKCLKARKECFGYATFYAASIPSMLGGPVLFAWSSPQKHRMTTSMLKKRMNLISGKMLYYTPLLQRAIFQLPRYILEDASL